MEPIPVDDPRETAEFAKRFADRRFGVMSMFGSAGIGKTTSLEQELRDLAVWSSGRVSPIQWFVKLFLNCAEPEYVRMALSRGAKQVDFTDYLKRGDQMWPA